ncbi:Protein of unknown function [Gryllus bimaculatus]|nr:Protein of unknown function [Gryllus bimaculatus]
MSGFKKRTAEEEEHMKRVVCGRCGKVLHVQWSGGVVGARMQGNGVGMQYSEGCGMCGDGSDIQWSVRGSEDNNFIAEAAALARCEAASPRNIPMRIKQKTVQTISMAVNPINIVKILELSFGTLTMETQFPGFGNTCILLSSPKDQIICFAATSSVAKNLMSLNTLVFVWIPQSKENTPLEKTTKKLKCFFYSLCAVVASSSSSAATAWELGMAGSALGLLLFCTT